MLAVLIPVIIVVVVAAAAVAGVIAVTRRQTRRADHVDHGDVAALRYRVPEGQDPSAIVAALHQEGYAAVGESQDVVVPCRADPDRERAHVRSVIAAAGTNIEGDPSPEQEIRFADE